MKLKTFQYIFLLVIMASCRTSNRKVFEKFTDINIPKTVKVTNDEYQDMGQDYVKILELQLDKESKADLELSILKSKYFNSSVYSDNGISETQQLTIDNNKGLWYRCKSGYSFSGSTNKNRDIVFVTFDTLVMKVKFEYSSD